MDQCCANQSNKHTGLALFRGFAKYELGGNQRSGEFPEWATLIANLRCRTPGAFPFRDFFVPYIQDYILTRAALLKTPTLYGVDMLCSGNFDRAILENVRASSVARLLGVPVIKWRLNISGIDLYSDEQLETVYADDLSLWGIFIQGAPGYLTQNINVSRGLANGTEVLFQSLVLNPNTPALNAIDCASIYYAKAGEVVIIKHPYAILVDSARR